MRSLVRSLPTSPPPSPASVTDSVLSFTRLPVFNSPGDVDDVAESSLILGLDGVIVDGVETGVEVVLEVVPQKSCC